jgi:hypothetical protein
MCESTDPLILLRGGLVVPVAPYLLLLRLERDGCTVRLDADGGLLAAPRDRLTATDLAELRKWRPHIALLLQYTPDDRHLFCRSDPNGAPTAQQPGRRHA